MSLMYRGGGVLEPDPGLVVSKEACHDMEQLNMDQICIRLITEIHIQPWDVKYKDFIPNPFFGL